MVADSMVINPEPDLKSGHNGIVGGKAVNFKASRLSSSLRLPKLTQTVVPTVFTYNPNNIVKPRIQLVNEANGDRVPKLNVSDSAIVISKNKANTLGSSPKRRPNLSFNEKEVPKDQSSPFCLKTSSNSGDSSPPYLKASNAAPPEVDKMIGAVGALKVQGNSPIRTSMRYVTGKFFGGEVKVHGGKSGFGFSRLCSGDGDEDEDKDTNVDSPGTNLSNGDTNTNTTCLISEVNFHETETFLNVSTHGVPRFSALSTTGSQSVTTTRREQPIGGELLRSDATMSPKNNRHSSNNENSKIQVKSRNEYKYDLTTLETTSSTSHVPSALYEFDKRRHQGSPDKDKVSVPSSPPYSSPTESQYRLYQPSLQQIEKLPEGVELTLSELEEMACRQQHQIDAQRQLLAAKEQRLRFLKQHEARHQQVAVEHERLRRLRDRVEAQELKLKKLRALRGQVDHTKLNNASLTSDLKSIRALFNEKEKELSMAVAKVEELTLQLEDLKKGRGSIPSPPSTATSELDKLRRELMYRNKLNEQQSVRLTQQREALALRQEEVSAIDRRISELQDRLQRKRLSNQQMAEQLSNAGNKPNDQLTRNTLSSSALQHHIQHHQLKYQEQKMNSCPSVPLYQSVHLQSNKQSHKDRIEPFSQVPSSKAPDIESDFLKNVNNNNNISSNNNNINNNNNNNNIYQLSNSMNQRKISQDDFQTSNCLNNKNLISEISSTKHISNYNVNNSNQNKCSINSLSNHVTNNNLINRTALTNMEPKLSPNSNDRLSEFSVSKSDPKYQTLPYNTKFTLDYNPSNPPAQSKFSNCAAVRKPGEGNESVPNDNIELNQGQNMVHGMPVHSSSMKALGAPLANQNQPKHLLPPPLPPPSSSSPASSSSSSSSVNLAPRVYNLSGPMASSLLTRGQPVGGASSTTSSTTSLATTSSSAGSSTNNSNQVESLVVLEKAAGSGDTGILRDLKVGSSQNSMTPNTNLDSVHNKPALPPKPALPGKPTPPPPPRQSALWAPLHENSDNQRLLSEHISNEASRFAQLEFLDITNSRLMEKRPKPVVDISSEAVDTALNVLRGSVNVSSRGGNSMEQVNSKNKPESQSESSSPLPPPPQSDQPIEERRHDKQLMKPWPSITKKQSPPDQNHVKNDKNIDLTNDTTNNEVMNVHVSLNRRIEMPPAFFFPENATPPADLIASANQESYDQLDRSFPKQNCDEVLSSKLHNDAKENGSGGSDSSQENIFSSETTSNESQEESNVAVRIKKGNLKGGNGHSNGLKRRVSFDPLALLLDASLEGELELVMKTAGQVKDPSAANDEGITALHNAICAGHIDIVRFLVQFGCDVNAQDSDGWTPLHCAASCNNVAMVRFLVEHGACIFAQTLSDHETAAEKCEEDEEGFDGCSEFLYSVQEKLGILNNGAVYAVFDYEAHNPDELSFREGDRLIVLRKGDECEKEWWWSRHSDREGYIPRNLLGLYPRVRPNKAASE